ncbi:phage head morphogenesis protein [Novosphingobium sp. KACC 22771]|uniref:phage head morphogenesis protein n=1 Tax=Novosphingobium sp. KACC 22771 TaxID=3025670 RepID=UPI002366CF0B|nr:phage minor head protein [Novosphingobium sp. KACC 22771]WDF73517.1 phage minor head protein [Novosphingobium sp. KACC 22771]
MADNLGYSIFLDPKDTVRAWEMRGALQPTVKWSEMMHEQHAVAFTVAKIAKLDLLRQIQTSLDTVIREGGTFEGWKANILPNLQSAGWWGTVANKDLTGTDQPITVNERRLRTIYDTNVRMSLASGHWTRIQSQKDVFPYLRYLPSTSEHKRPLHMAWYGTLLPVDHPWWQTHFPPNGWFCKCHFEQVSERKMAKKGWSITPVGDIATGPAQQFIPASGNPISVPAGIDPGFGFNPGTAHLRAVADKAANSIQMAVDAGLETAARQTVHEIVADPAFAQFVAIPQLPFPVAVIGQAEKAALNSNAWTILLSKDTMAKQDSHHEELTLDDYRQLPQIVETGFSEQQDAGRMRYFWKDDEGKWWRAAIKSTANKLELFVASLHRLNEKEGRKLNIKYGDNNDAR